MPPTAVTTGETAGNDKVGTRPGPGHVVEPLSPAAMKVEVPLMASMASTSLVIVTYVLAVSASATPQPP